MNSRPSALIVAYDFPPHGAVGTMRTLRLVRHLDRLGWQVSVLTGDPATFLPSTPVDEGLLARVPSATRVVRVRAWRNEVTPSAQPDMARAEPSASRRSRRWPKALVRARRSLDALTAIPDRESSWLVPAVREGLRTFRRNAPDIIYSSAPPWTGQVAAGILAARLGRPWVADFRDPWARLPWRENRPWILKRTAAWFERQTVNRAAAIVFTTENIARDVAAHHDPALTSRYHIVPNGCDVSELAELAPVRNDRFVLLHAGSLYGGRDPRPLIRAIAWGIAEGSIDPHRFELRMIGPVVLDGIDVKAECDHLGLNDVVRFIPRMPRREALIQMKSASALLLVQPAHPLSIPAKAYEYLAAGRPILAMADAGETADLVRRSGAGIVVSGSDEAGLLTAVLSLIRHDGPRPPVDPAFYDGDRRAAEIVNILDAVLQRPGAAVRPLGSAYADA